MKKQALIWLAIVVPMMIGVILGTIFIKHHDPYKDFRPPAPDLYEIIEVDKVARITCYVDKGIMASGRYTYPGAVATSDRTIPFGTKIYVEEFGEMIVEDRTNKRFENVEPMTIDIYFTGTRQECLDFGVKYLSYKIVE